MSFLLMHAKITISHTPVPKDLSLFPKENYFSLMMLSMKSAWSSSTARRHRGTLPHPGPCSRLCLRQGSPIQTLSSPSGANDKGNWDRRCRRRKGCTKKGQASRRAAALENSLDLISTMMANKKEGVTVKSCRRH